MKSSSFHVLPILAAMLCFLSSCTNSDQSKTAGSTTTDSSTGDAIVTPATPVNTIVTTPQGIVSIRHRVKDFNAWRLVYESNDSARLANGLHNYVISRGVDDSSMVMVALKVDDMTKAKAFVSSAGLKQVMQKGGVIGTPIISFATMMFQDTSMLSSYVRSLTTFSVKDYAAWVKAFKEGEQERIDNGITVRAYGHDPDDSNKVRLVTAIMDSAKAHTYWNSDMLKKRRAASGVITAPERFVYRVVKRY